jgi:hypothetical protein
MKSAATSALAQPLYCSLFIGGDWNFLPPDEHRLSVFKPKTPPPNDNYTGQHNDIFQAVFNLLIDHAPDTHTRYDASTSTVSRLDRIYSAIPSWIIPSITIRAYVQMTATALHLKKISDHAPATILFAKRSSTIASEQPISPTVLRSDAFRTFFDIFFDDVFECFVFVFVEYFENVLLECAMIGIRVAINGCSDLSFVEQISNEMCTIKN